jgi:alkaline phosphatase D
MPKNKESPKIKQHHLGLTVRMRKFLIIIIVSISFTFLLQTGFNQTTTVPPAQSKENKPDKTKFRIGFGSCHNALEPLDIWKPINSLAPNVWIWGGDIIYADTENTETHKRLYKELNRVTGYKELKQKSNVIGTWDDHDYGSNDAGAEYKAKKESQIALLDFLSEPLNSLRRQQEGVYTKSSYSFKGHPITVLLLDVRYHRQSPGITNDILGSEQWSWLEDAIKHDKSELLLVVSGSQVIPKDHSYEKWNDYPQARTRLLNLLYKANAQFKVILSGDRHHAEISKISEAASNKTTNTIYELTASGMTHAREYRKAEFNPYRVGGLYAQRNFGLLEVSKEPEMKNHPAKLLVNLQIYSTSGQKVNSVHLSPEEK